MYQRFTLTRGTPLRVRRAAAFHASLLMNALTFTLACPQEAALGLHNRSSGSARRIPSAPRHVPTPRVNNRGSAVALELVITFHVVLQQKKKKKKKH